MTDANAQSAKREAATNAAPAATAATAEKPAAKKSGKTTRAPSKPGDKKPAVSAAKPATAKAKAPKASKAATAKAKPNAKSAATRKASAQSTPKAAAKAKAAAQANKDKTMKDTIETMTVKGNEAIKEGFEKTLTAVNDANAFQKDNVDAMIASATAAGKGIEAINTNAISYAKTAMEGSVAAAKAVSSAKSIQEMFEIQANFAKSAMDAYIAEINKTTDLVSTTMKDTVKPLNERVAASVELAQSFR